MSEEEKRNESLRQDNLELNLELTAKVTELRNLSDETERQASELSRVNEENSRLNDCLNHTEVSLRDCQLKLQDKTDEVGSTSFNFNILSHQKSLPILVFESKKCNDLDSRLLRMGNEFKSYQQKYQYTLDDIQMHETKLSNMEFELEEAQNQIHLLRLENQDLNNTYSNLKADFEYLSEQKANCEREITRLEGSISDLQMELTSAHQQFKKDV